MTTLYFCLFFSVGVYSGVLDEVQCYVQCCGSPGLGSNTPYVCVKPRGCFNSARLGFHHIYDTCIMMFFLSLVLEFNDAQKFLRSSSIYL